MHPTLVISGILALLAAIAYGGLGLLLWRRPMPAPRRRPWRAYAGWWAIVGALLALSAATFLFAAAGVTATALHVVHAHVERLLLVIGLWCIMAYLSYLQLGNERLWAPLAVFYALLWVQLTYSLLASNPSGVILEEWARPSLETSGPSTVFSLGVRLQVFLPPLVAVLLHLRLIPFSSPHARRRVLATSGAVAVWLILPGFAYFQPDVTWLQVASRAATLAAGLTLLWTYRPVLDLGAPATPPKEAVRQ